MRWQMVCLLSLEQHYVAICTFITLYAHFNGDSVHIYMYVHIPAYVCMCTCTLYVYIIEL